MNDTLHSTFTWQEGTTICECYGEVNQRLALKISWGCLQSTEIFQTILPIKLNIYITGRNLWLMLLKVMHKDRGKWALPSYKALKI